MITEFRHIALFAQDRTGTSVIFPADDAHDLTIGLPHKPAEVLRGGAALRVRDRNGVAVEGAAPEVVDPDSRMPNLSTVLGAPVKADGVANIIGNGAAKAALRLSGGRIVAHRGEPSQAEDEPYMDRVWEFGNGQRSLLTNFVTFELPFDPQYTYELEYNGKTVRLSDADTIRVAHTDTGEAAAPAGAVIVLDDFGLLYALLSPAIGGPVPYTPREWKKEENPTRPLCPVGYVEN